MFLVLLVLTSFAACSDPEPVGKKAEIHDDNLMLEAIVVAYFGGHIISVGEVTKMCSNCVGPSVTGGCSDTLVTLA